MAPHSYVVARSAEGDVLLSPSLLCFAFDIVWFWGQSRGQPRGPGTISTSARKSRPSFLPILRRANREHIFDRHLVPLLVRLSIFKKFHNIIVSSIQVGCR